MEVLNYSGPVEFMRPLAEAWRKETQPEHLGIQIVAGRFMETLHDLANDPDSCLLLLGHEGRAVGFIGGVLFDSPVEYKTVVQDRYWFVLPKHRGEGPMKLKKALQEWAEERGASYLMMSASRLASERHDGVCKIYARTMNHFETTYIQELQNGMLLSPEDTSTTGQHIDAQAERSVESDAGSCPAPTRTGRPVPVRG